MDLAPLKSLTHERLEATLGLIYPNVCQICRSEHATLAEGYVCKSCWSRRGAIRFIIPPFCEKCGLPFEGEITNSFVCSNCRDMALQFEFARAAVAATGVVRDVIHRYKYDRAFWFEPFLSDLLIRCASSGIDRTEWDLIVPVPLHALREREREFNQAERLAILLGNATGVPVNGRLLKRVEPTRTQTQLTKRQRTENVRNAFVLRPRQALSGGRIILVDDVLTTGATTSACAQVLRRHGATRVCVWTVARGL